MEADTLGPMGTLGPKNIPANVGYQQVGSDGFDREKEIYCHGDSQPQHHNLHKGVILKIMVEDTSAIGFR